MEFRRRFRTTWGCSTQLFKNSLMEDTFPMRTGNRSPTLTTTNRLPGQLVPSTRLDYPRPKMLIWRSSVWT